MPTFMQDPAIPVPATDCHLDHMHGGQRAARLCTQPLRRRVEQRRDWSSELQYQLDAHHPRQSSRLAIANTYVHFLTLNVEIPR